MADGLSRRTDAGASRSGVTWEAVLDALAERVRAQEQAIELHGVVPPELAAAALPVADGPLPQHLAVRAAALLERMREVEARAGYELSRLRSRHA